jgi:hypothetical protein
MRARSLIHPQMGTLALDSRGANAGVRANFSRRIHVSHSPRPFSQRGQNRLPLALTADNFMIGGLTITENDPSQLVLRGIGPSLSNFGGPNPPADPFLELRNGNGVLIVANNNWRDNQETALQNTLLAPATTSDPPS